MTDFPIIPLNTGKSLLQFCKIITIIYILKRILIRNQKHIKTVQKINDGAPEIHRGLAD